MADGIVGEFFDLKAGTDAELLAMQCGDFYEFFADDAETVSDELDLKVSQKSSHGSSYAMAGVPVDDLTPYLKALVERGYRVAVADQYDTDDGHAREVTRVVTPGTLLETTEENAQYLATLVRDSGRDGPTYGLAFADVTTGKFFVTERGGADAWAETLTELYRFDPVELLPGPEVRNDDDLLDTVRERTSATLTLHTAEAFAAGRSRHRLREHFGEETLESVGVADAEAAVRAGGAVLSYVEETGVGVLESITRLRTARDEAYVTLDATTQRNLELTETMQGDRSGSLFDTIDHTVTSAGGRLLREWLARPRQSRGELDRRQACVAALAEAAMARDRLQETLEDAYDLQRLTSRTVSGTADARDLVAIRETLDCYTTVVNIVESTERLAESPITAVVTESGLTGDDATVDSGAIDALAEELSRALVDDPPGTITQGGLFRSGFDTDLDDLIERHEAALEWLDSLPDREKRHHDITHLSVDRNKTDGYYIQVGNSETDAVPGEYDQIKSLKNSKRYTIPELEEKEREVLRLEERRYELERSLFEGLREEVAGHAGLLQVVGNALAAVDIYASLATHAVRNDWTRPELTDGRELAVEGGRHPVVEQATQFVPNDLRMDGLPGGGGDDSAPTATPPRQFLIVTGPNMSGKSTYMRQAALIVLLAQIGSFVPARQARVGVVDGIFTRVGALDELAQGRSTFMVEMQELSNILHSATGDSLVILDEVGRGTATYDGISIAWAATEYLHNEVRAKTLFATHYHELTTLADHLPRVANVHVAVDDDPAGSDMASDGAEVTFLRTVRDGPTDRSYGVHVADLAGVPEPVVDRARTVLARLREDEAIEAKGAASGDPVQTVFDLESGEFKSEGGPDSDAGSRDTSPESAPNADRHDRTAQTDPEAVLADAYGEGAPDVVEELAAIDVNETPPVELIAKVQEWQRSLED
jgi:DNA mismatch repair protein MutS